MSERAGGPGEEGAAPRPQVGVVLVTHGHQGDEMLVAAEALVGGMPRVRAISAPVGEAVAATCCHVEAVAAALDQGAGILFLTDLHGSSPANACLREAAAARRSAVLSGLNLAMLVKLSTCDLAAEAPEELALRVAETGRRSIQLMPVPAVAAMAGGAGRLPEK